MTQPVVLAVCLSAHSRESMTFYNALKTFTFRSTGDIHICGVCKHIAHREGVA